MVCWCAREPEVSRFVKDMRIKQSKTAHGTKPVNPCHDSEAGRAGDTISTTLNPTP